MIDLKKIFLQNTDNTFLQLFRYIFVGGAAFIADFGLLYVLTEYIGLHYLLSATFSFIVGLIINYSLSKVWVFSGNTIKKRWMEFIVFSLIGMVGLGLNNLFLWIFTDYCSIHYMLSKIFTTIIVFFWNFLGRKFILFNSTESAS
jgi:putative flippase GtrA